MSLAVLWFQNMCPFATSNTGFVGYPHAPANSRTAPGFQR